MDCKLCGLPAPITDLEEDGFAFCCLGCREVYRQFGNIILPVADQAGSVESIVEIEGKEAYLRIDGMHCSSCELLIERLALRVDGIVDAKSNYATSTAKIVYDPDRVNEADLPEILSRSGYRARFSNAEAPKYDERMPTLRLAVAGSLVATVMMLYLAFYYPMHLGLVDIAELEPVRWLVHKAVPMTLFLLTSVLIGYVAIPIFRGAWIGFKTGVLNMDNLLVIAILAAYFYSIGQMVAGSLDLYFDVASTIIAVVTIGRFFEREAKARATEELARLMDAWAPVIRARRYGELISLATSELQPAERIVVLEGEMIPVDGTIVEGQSAIDESLMTGEPFPIARTIGERVLGGTRLVEGSLEIEAGHALESQLDNLARVLWNAQSSTAGIRGMADRVARVFVPTVVILAVAIGWWQYSEGASLGVALLAGMATLIVSCPCTFGLAIPLTTAVGVSVGLRNGIIITSADTFEKTHRIHTIAIDKTGILSTANMVVTKIIGPEKVKEYAAAVERLSAHPIAEAIARLDTRYNASDIEIQPGKGAIALVDDHRVAVGSQALFTVLGWQIPASLMAKDSTAGVGSYVGWDGRVYGRITTEDQPRPGWQSIIDKLRQQARVVLLTGAENAGIYENKFDQVFAGIPPEGKAAVIRQLKTQGTVVMIGDGSNDAPSLAEADLGIAFGAPTALAADAADVIIPGDRLDRVFTTLELISTIRRRIRQNLVWALWYNVIAITLAISGYLNPLFAALAMSSSSLLVIWNSSKRLKNLEPDEPLPGQLRSDMKVV